LIFEILKLTEAKTGIATPQLPFQQLHLSKHTLHEEDLNERADRLCALKSMAFPSKALQPLLAIGVGMSLVENSSADTLSFLVGLVSPWNVFANNTFLAGNSFLRLNLQ